ncbi:MAG: hypothetical protein E7646_01585 [Ruminococcaceae bacterium]|nr:hypothetical protein [Oscillospiraceae bacterium]
MEKYTQIFYKEDDQKIKPSQSFEFEFDYDLEAGKEHRVFFTGEVDNFYFWKCEYCCPTMYKRIDESLVPGEEDAWALKFEGADFPRCAFRKMAFPLGLSYLGLHSPTEDYVLSVRAKADGLKVKEGGYARLRIEVRNKKSEDFYNNHTKYPADSIIDIDFPRGSYDWQEFSVKLNLPKETTANIIYSLETELTEGDIYFEHPALVTSDGFNIMPGFARDSAIYQYMFNWYGVNLSKSEWPKMGIEVNGTEVFSDIFFERCHRYSEKEITLPDGVMKKGKNSIRFTLLSDWFGALPYRLHEVGIVSEDKNSFDVVSFPEVAVCGEEFSLMLDIHKPCTLKVESSAAVVSSLVFESEGLAALRLVSNKLQNGLEIALSDGETTHNVKIGRVIRRFSDGVITGTGDLIYVEQTDHDTFNYIKWYMQNRVGNMLTIRPTYRWSGTRMLNKPMWKKFVKLMNSLGMKYSHMVDGREPSGYCAQPSLSELGEDTGEPSGFLGRQLHERDGAYCYWGAHDNNGDFWNMNKFYDTALYFDQFNRYRHADPEHAGSEFYPEDQFDDGKLMWLCHDPKLAADSAIQANAVINSLRTIAKDCTGATRHTGPSIFFKYFCQAGYSWIGAETMDSPTEFLMAALRGAAEAYNIPRVGVHHALQWSTQPHDEEGHYRRYRLALYVSWMQGAHENNTEEGLWRLEERYAFHNRHGIACRSHLDQQKDFYRWISTHSRRGRLAATVGVLHGRCDGAPCFGGCVWGNTAARFSRKFDAELSWRIPGHSFYPHSKWPATSGNADTKNGKIGLVSQNPRGSMNIIPVEEDFKDYPFLCFFGYNLAEKKDLERILEKVRKGAVLQLTLGHLSCTSLREKTEKYELDFFENELLDAIGYAGVPKIEQDDFNGNTVPVATNLSLYGLDIKERTQKGYPLMAEKKVGEGKIIIFNTLLYPANEAIKELYTESFERYSDEAFEAQDVKVKVGDDVQAVVYELEDGTKEAYLVAVDWWNDADKQRRARVCIGDDCYPVTLGLGVVKKLSVNGKVGILCQSEDCDVVTYEDGKAVLQGSSKQEFLLLKDNKITALEVDFDASPVVYQEI